MEQTVDLAIKEISSMDKNICLTGGNFGKTLAEGFLMKDIDISSWDIFLTDERLNCSKQDQIQFILLQNLKRVKGFNILNFNPFLQGDYNDSYKFLEQKIKDIYFDITFLSLGEDGHLAGQFSNSNLIKDTKFCHTTDAEKEPKERISFTVEYLFKSKKVVLAVMGETKRKAILDLAEGKGLHSDFWNKENLVVISDIKI